MFVKKRAVFLDRDGVINEAVDRGDNFFVNGKKVRWTAPFNRSELCLKPDIKKSLDKIGEWGFLRILITSQPDVAYGTLSRQEHDSIMAEIAKLPLDDIFVCLHGRDDGCNCKKPKPGLLLKAADKWQIDLSSSLIIGDTVKDVEAGRAAGCVTAVIDYPYNQEAGADIRAKDLLEAVEKFKKIEKQK